MPYPDEDDTWSDISRDQKRVPPPRSREEEDIIDVWEDENWPEPQKPTIIPTVTTTIITTVAEDSDEETPPAAAVVRK